MRFVIIGGNSAIAQACRTHWEAQGHTCISQYRRATDDAEGIVNAMATRADIEALAQAVVEAKPDRVFLCYGNMIDGWESLEDAEQCTWSNYTSPMLLTQAILKADSFARVGVISSVAGDLLRAQNAHYSAAKRALQGYLFAAAHHVPGRVLDIRLGFVDTPMLPPQKGFQAKLVISPGQAAEKIAEAFEKDTPMTYIPGIWRFIMFALKCVPMPIYRKSGL